MRAGQLDQRIEIQRRTDLRDATGQPIPTWATLADNVPAAFDPVRGLEFFQAQALTATNAALFRMRWFSGIAAGDRVIYDGRTWDIAAVVHRFGRERETDLYCETGLTEG